MLRASTVGIAVLVAVAGQALAAPPGPPPKVAGASAAPPPAWIEARAVQRWLAFSSYCWKTACVDFIPPTMRTGVPSLRVSRDQATRIHFRFLPERVTVSPVTKQGAGKSVRLAAARVTTWRPKAAGLYTIFTDAAAGDASYLVRIKLRSS